MIAANYQILFQAYGDSMSFRHRVLAPSLFLAFSSSLCLAQQSMDNSAVIKLTKSGLSEDLIVQTITASAGHYDTSTDALIALKQAGVTDKEVGAMLTKNAGPAAAPSVAAPSTGSSLPAGVDEIGVYYKDKTGNWLQFTPEVVNFKSGGVLKSIASNGIVKGDKNGHLPGASAKTSLTRPMTVLIYAPEGTAATEYQLLKLRVNSDNREFRSETGGVFHSSGGAQRDGVAFTPTKVGTRLYQVVLGPEVATGEYGILPPGSLTSSNAASAGKMYTFHLVE
jgi:hypothetical protein